MVGGQGFLGEEETREGLGGIWGALGWQKSKDRTAWQIRTRPRSGETLKNRAGPWAQERWHQLPERLPAVGSWRGSGLGHEGRHPGKPAPLGSR